VIMAIFTYLHNPQPRSQSDITLKYHFRIHTWNTRGTSLCCNV